MWATVQANHYAFSMLKDKKKLNNKIDSLNRKVQILQTKLNVAAEAAAKAPSPPPALPPKAPVVFSPSPTFTLAPAPIIPGPSSAFTSRPTPSSRQRIVTAPASRSSPENAAPPPMPTYRPKTPDSRSRMMSGPSSSSRPKTPESRSSHMPVFKARTPERHRAPTTTSAEAPNSSSLIPPGWVASGAIGVVNLARLTGELSVLPSAFIACICSEAAAYSIAHGVTREDGALERLSPEDLIVCFESQSGLRAASITAVFRTFKPVVSQKCKTVHTCKTALRDVLIDLEENVAIS